MVRNISGQRKMEVNERKERIRKCIWKQKNNLILSWGNRIAFDAHLFQINTNRLAETIFFRLARNPRKKKIHLFIKVKTNLAKLNIPDEEILDSKFVQ